MTPLTSLTLLRDILLGHHVTRSRISVFHADLSTIQRSLDLHAVPHATLQISRQCPRHQARSFETLHSAGGGAVKTMLMYSEIFLLVRWSRPHNMTFYAELLSRA